MIRVIANLALLMAVVVFGGAASAQDNLPKVTVSLEATEIQVGQPLTVRVKVLVPTWMPRAPEIPNLEQPSLMVRLPPRSTHPISEQIGGETWSGVTRTLILYPLRAGVFEVPDTTFKLAYAEPGNPKPIEYEAPVPGIRFVATVPPKARDLSPLIIARNFTLEQQIEGAAEMAVGGAVTRTLTAKIDGTTAVLIPQLSPDDTAPNLRSYPKDPVIQEDFNERVLSGSRQEITTFIALDGGAARLPDVQFDWFNLTTGAVETASVPGVDLTVSGKAVPEEEPIDTKTIALWVAGVLLALAVIWGFFHKYGSRIKSFFIEMVAKWKASELAAHLAVKAAMSHQNLDETLRAQDHWLGFYPGAPAADLADLDAAIVRIGEARFGQTPTQANWQQLRQAYGTTRRKFKAQARHKEKASHLPPLNP